MLKRGFTLGIDAKGGITLCIDAKGVNLGIDATGVIHPRYIDAKGGIHPGYKC